jgi:hypothetical protein
MYIHTYLCLQMYLPTYVYICTYLPTYFYICTYLHMLIYVEEIKKITSKQAPEFTSNEQDIFCAGKVNSNGLKVYVYM